MICLQSLLVHDHLHDIHIYTNACAVLSPPVYLSSCDCYGEVLLHVASCVVGCRVMVCRYALGSFVGCSCVLCGPCLRAGWEALCSSISVMGLSRRGRGAEHNSFPCVLLSSWCHDRELLPTSLGCGHHGRDVVIDAVLIRTIRAL
jgi:hypothetical protein